MRAAAKPAVKAPAKKAPVKAAATSTLKAALRAPKPAPVVATPKPPIGEGPKLFRVDGIEGKELVAAIDAEGAVELYARTSLKHDAFTIAGFTEKGRYAVLVDAPEYKVSVEEVTRVDGTAEVTPVVPVKVDPPAPKVPRAWLVSGAGFKNRRHVAFGADEAVKEFAAANLTGGNLAEIGTGIANPNRSVDFVVKVEGGTHLVNVEAAK